MQNCITVLNHLSTTFVSKHISHLIKNKKLILNNLLYTVAIILVVLWAIGYLGYQAGGIIHLLLVIAIVAILLRVIKGKTQE